MFTNSSHFAEGTERFQQYLLPDESILWTGRPLTRIVFHKSDWYAIPFSLLWGGFAIFWEYGVATDPQQGDQSVLTPSHTHFHFDNFMLLFGIPFVLAGLYIIFGRFFYTAWKKGRTFYAVTNKRVLVLNTAPNRKLVDAFFPALTSVSLATRSDGAGTVEFAPETDSMSWFGRGRRNNIQMDIDLGRLVFYDVDNVRDVYQLIQAQRARYSSAGDTVYRPR
ncbi:hypothetical protein GCM10011507_22070 [Edaphobacter acidisoli]|uniref:DUF304 domain-containing protein n=1 Tax=Edaphobacter acidisoli TaxID=2040573 RepID=A0A916RTW7_9BACT|nr:hypothetical protein [Edaphobacter acidisoli]GGA70068.1 hypothetical protein GCM10011507_22070 [Edaphobacter acidisoli]